MDPATPPEGSQGGGEQEGGQVQVVGPQGGVGGHQGEQGGGGGQGGGGQQEDHLKEVQGQSCRIGTMRDIFLKPKNFIFFLLQIKLSML